MVARFNSFFCDQTIWLRHIFAAVGPVISIASPNRTEAASKLARAKHFFENIELFWSERLKAQVHSLCQLTSIL